MEKPERAGTHTHRHECLCHVPAAARLVRFDFETERGLEGGGVGQGDDEGVGHLLPRELAGMAEESDGPDRLAEGVGRGAQRGDAHLGAGVFRRREDRMEATDAGFRNVRR